jgi:uncharacterized protein YjiS (DUF1127 family)
MTVFATDFESTAHDAALTKKPSRTASALATVTQFFTNARHAAAQRHLRSELAAMDDNLLKDIGVAEDEIYLIRAGQVFTPRAWNRTAATTWGV